jgi:hypothetical protein
MKHIKLFEDFSGAGGMDMGGMDMGKRPGFGGTTEYLIGYFATGGIGSHPGIVTREELSRVGQRYSDFDFYETSRTSQMPQALLCIFDADELWRIEPITNQKADAIYNIGGKEDYIAGDDEMEEVMSIIDTNILNGLNDIEVISVLKDVKVNTVYWSDAPEKTHGLWQAEDVRPCSVKSFAKNGGN